MPISAKRTQLSKTVELAFYKYNIQRLIFIHNFQKYLPNANFLFKTNHTHICTYKYDKKYNKVQGEAFIYVGNYCSSLNVA